MIGMLLSEEVFSEYSAEIESKTSFFIILLRSWNIVNQFI